MRDRQQRLQWIENLISGKPAGEMRRRAIVIPTAWGDAAVAFDAISEIVPGTAVQPFAFLPPEFCAVANRDMSLAPVIDVRRRTDLPSKVMIAHGCGCELGLMYTGTPRVVDMAENAANDAPGGDLAEGAASDAAGGDLAGADAAALPALPDVLVKSGLLQTPEGPAQLLDLEATIAHLLERE